VPVMDVPLMVTLSPVLNAINAPYTDAVYVTFSVSPDAIERFPPVKLPAEYKVPAVPDLVLLVVINAPATVAVALMVKDVAVDTLDPEDAEFQATDGRVELE